MHKIKTDDELGRHEVHSAWCQQFRPQCCSIVATTGVPCLPCRAAFQAGLDEARAEIELPGHRGGGCGDGCCWCIQEALQIAAEAKGE